MSKSRVIGVLGTEATVRQPYVDDLAAKFAADCTIIRHGSPELVELAEAKLAGEDVSVEAVRAAAQPMFDAPGGDRIDTIVLACTHFPLLERRASRRLSRRRLRRRRRRDRATHRLSDARAALAGRTAAGHRCSSPAPRARLASARSPASASAKCRL